MISLKSSLKLLQLEVIITGTLIMMPIAVPFYKSIGMDQGQIGLSQAVFTLALLLVNIPTGWIADRFSRKFSNAIGDLGCAIAVLLYSMAGGFAQVVLCEMLFGLSLAFSQGADGALIKAHSEKIDKSGGLLHKINSSNAIWRPIAQIVAVIIGGFVGSYNLRLAVAISAIPFLAGVVFSLLIREEGERLVSKHKNPLRDMLRVTHETVMHSPRLRWLMLAYAVGFRVTNVTIWAFTPMLIFVGVPFQIVALGWVLNSLSCMFGAMIAKKHAERFKRWQRFAMPITLVIVSLIVMGFGLSIYTVWLYSLLGLAWGWNTVVLKTMLQREIPDRSQATGLSIADTASQLLYVPLVWVVALAGNFDIRLSLLATAAIFAPMAIIIALKLKKFEMK
ncbi:MAG: MFS transporter [Candidatus Saccharibacteria bacterium]